MGGERDHAEAEGGEEAMKLIVMMLFVVTLAACAPPAEELMFLTRDGCVQTEAMRQNLDAALAKLGRPITYQVVEVASLPPDDVRRGYQTPTLLAYGRDVFAIPVPTPPFPEPTCRDYPGGVPST